MFEKLDAFHQTRTGYAVFAVIELALAYVFISWAIDGGSWFDYGLALIFTIGFLQNFIKLVGTFFRGRQSRRTR
jgi:hypothetical protein